MRPDRPGIPAADLPALFAAPALLAAGPALFGWHLSRNFAQQFGAQLATFEVGPKARER